MNTIEVRRLQAIASKAKQMFRDDYNRVRWFSEAEAAKATEERNKLLHLLNPALSADGDEANGMKPHIGPISPGCRICQHGGWDCTWINTHCTRRCFFCSYTHDPSKCRNHAPRCKLGNFLNAQDHVEYIKMFDIKGVGFSGGEPLLQLNVLLKHIEAIRSEFGSTIHIWIYTNGDLVDKHTLWKLKNAGLNEIRFNIAAREYDLRPLALARQYIPILTVETPAIPDDLYIMKQKMKKLEALGVDHLNLHQLRTSQYNYRVFRKCNYTFISNIWHAPIHQSEMCCLKLMRFAVEENIAIPINYCSKIYKDTFQTRNNRVRLGSLFLKPFEELTEVGLIRKIELTAPQEVIAKYESRLKRDGADLNKWYSSPDQCRINIHSDLLRYGDVPSMGFRVLYIDASKGRKKDVRQRFSKKGMKIDYRLIHRSKILSPHAIKAWSQLYIDKQDKKRVFDEYHKALLVDAGSLHAMTIEEDELRGMALYEEIQCGLPDVC
ncbi:MAG: radical SAM protein [Candidatus Hodarchaeota archaeon]